MITIQIVIDSIDILNNKLLFSVLTFFKNPLFTSSIITCIFIRM